MGYKENRQWADSYLGQVAKILRENAAALMHVFIAPDDVDRKNATDVILRLAGGDVAVRLRRPGCKYRDLTIRSRLESGYRTELSKIKEGFADWYLYGWLDHQGKIDEWILVDLDKARAYRGWEGCKEISNTAPYDGTYFIAIKLKNLRDHDCIIAELVR